MSTSRDPYNVPLFCAIKEINTRVSTLVSYSASEREKRDALQTIGEQAAEIVKLIEQQLTSWNKEKL